jgi:uncharacterized protein (UPF0332 family)
MLRVRFDEKARENLEAAERLLPDDESGELEALLNAAASRAYYAAYLAVADRAQLRGAPFTDDRRYYRHDTLPRDAVEWGIIDWDEREVLETLLSWRIKADYREDQVERDEASQALDHARSLMTRLRVVE